MSLDDIRIRHLPHRNRVELCIGAARAELAQDDMPQLMRALHEAGARIAISSAHDPAVVGQRPAGNRLDRAARWRLEAQLVDLIARAAALGAICPTNIALARDLGSHVQDKHVAGMFKRLEARGVLQVRRGHNCRQVIIVATGAATAPIRPTAANGRGRAK